MTKEAYVSYETAKLLKGKGFDEKVFTYYEDEVLKDGFWFEWNKSPLGHIAAPTHQMACAWLREKHNICITIYPDKGNGYEAVLYDIEDDVEIVLQSFGVYGIHIYEEIYEDAVEAALKYTLENLI